MKLTANGFLWFSFLLLLTGCTTSPVASGADENVSVKDSGQQRLTKDYFRDCRNLFSEARKMDSILLGQMEIDKVAATKAIAAFTDYAYYCQSDSMGPVFLIKAAQVARAINNIPQAKIVLERCIETYPSFSNRPAAIFLLAQLYDEPTYLNNEMEAKKLYQQIIDEYPQSDWGLSAKGAIAFIGKSDAEILKEFKKRNSKNEQK